MKRIKSSLGDWLKHANTPAVRAALSRFVGLARSATRHGLSAAGLAGIAAAGVFYFYPQLGEDLIALSPFAEHETSEEVAQATPDTAAATATAATTSAASVPALAAAKTAEPAASKAAASTAAATSAPVKASAALAVASETSKAAKAPAHPEQERVTGWIARRYRVASDAAHMLVGATYSTAREMHLDPLLILAVIAIESRFNPFAESPVGAKGLMQVMANVHRDKFQPLGGVQAALNPVANIKVGSTILKDYVNRTGSVESALKMYVGAGDAETDSGYGSKVISEYNKLKEVARGAKPTSPSSRAKPLPRSQEARSDILEAPEPA